MRVLVHDYGGYSFPTELSRSLARRGHQVLHLYCGSIVTPQGGLTTPSSDPETLTIRPVVLGRKIERGKLLLRRQLEIEHGKRVSREIVAFKPHVVISANNPLDSQRRLQATGDKLGVPMVFWLQDLIGLATLFFLKDRLPLVGELAGRHYIGMEKRLLHRSHAVVAISSDFEDTLVNWGIPSSKITVIENWASLAELPLRSRQNQWAEAHGLSETFNFIYTGTLGMKHNPKILLRLAKAFQNEPNVRVIVVSQGLGREWLQKELDQADAPRNLMLFDFQPFEALPDVLGAADVVTAILEADAGVLSVPSKVMTYMCSGRPMLLAVPDENLASRVVRDHECGLTSPPQDADAFIANARSLYDDAIFRRTLGENARRYAEEHFDIEKITDRFEKVFRSVVRETSH